MVNLKYCKVQIHKLSWFNHSFNIFFKNLTMPKKAESRSSNVSRKWNTWDIKSESKTYILLPYCDIYFLIISLSLCQLSFLFLEKSRVELKLFQYL